MPKRLIKLSRWLFSFALIALIAYLQERPIPSSNEPVSLYASVCQDDLRNTFVSAIREATESTHLYMYSLTDERIVQALNQKAQEGVKITLWYDPTTPQRGYQKLKKIQKVPIEISGLMHQKILIVDLEKVWIGSANFTTESLRLHDNLVTGLTSLELAHTIIKEKPHHTFTIGGQLVEFWTLPRDNKEGFNRLHELIEGANKTIRVAMYTWTHLELAETIIRAHQRGVAVEVILDQGQAGGVGKKVVKCLTEAGVAVWLSSGKKLLHHKCLVVDGSILVNGSTNWTKAAFSRNRDCFLIIHDLTEEQQAKLEKMWNRTRVLANKQEELQEAA